MTDDHAADLHSGSRDANGRFVKGAPSANPRGAPRKAARSKSLTNGMDPTADMVMRLARLPAAERGDGSIIDRQERALDALYRHGMDPKKPSLKALLEFIRITTAASAVEQKHLQEMLTFALQYKAEWGPKFALAERLNRPPPPTLPHPEDIEIHSDNTVSIVGPINRDELREMKLILNARDNHLAGLALMTDGPEKPELRSAIRGLRRRLALYNRALPPRLRKKE